MRFTVQLPTDKVDAGAEFVSAAAIAEMARAVESAGFDACFVTDHPMPGDRWLASGGHHALDPFVALSFAAAATGTLRLQTNVLVLPYRNPFLVAKAAATLDALSGGRLILGVAAGYLRPEFAALGVDFEERNELVDEALEAMVRAWTEDGVRMQGRHFEAKGNSMLPRPAQQPHPPIWVGGNSRVAIRRAVERGDGWLPFPTAPRMASYIRTAALATPDDLRERLAYAREHAEKVGRSRPMDVCFVPFELAGLGGSDGAAGPLRDSVAALAELGVTWIVLNVSCETRRDYLAQVDRLATDLLG